MTKQNDSAPDMTDLATRIERAEGEYVTPTVLSAGLLFFDTGGALLDAGVGLPPRSGKDRSGMPHR